MLKSKTTFKKGYKAIICMVSWGEKTSYGNKVDSFFIHCVVINYLIESSSKYTLITMLLLQSNLREENSMHSVLMLASNPKTQNIVTVCKVTGLKDNLITACCQLHL